MKGRNVNSSKVKGNWRAKAKGACLPLIFVLSGCTYVDVFVVGDIDVNASLDAKGVANAN